MKQAFTLIELLVVVLIIGILSAIALPQYQKAVEKSYAGEAFVLAKAIHQAQEEYRMANGSYTHLFSDLSISIPQVSGQSNPCALNPVEGGDTMYTKNFIMVLGSEGYLGDVIVVRNKGPNKCYGIGFIDGEIECGEIISKEADFCQKALGGTLKSSARNWRHYSLP